MGYDDIPVTPQEEEAWREKEEALPPTEEVEVPHDEDEYRQ